MADALRRWNRCSATSATTRTGSIHPALAEEGGYAVEALLPGAQHRETGAPRVCAVGGRRSVTCPLVPNASRLISGFCSSPRSFGLGFLQTPPRGDALALLLAFGSAKPGHRTFTDEVTRHAWRTRSSSGGCAGLIAQLPCNAGFGLWRTQRYLPATANTAWGFVLAIASKVRAAPLGCLRPCSQPCKVRTDTPMSAANWD